MAFLDHNGESEFPLPKDQVFEAMCQAIPTINGMKIDYADKLQGRIMVKAGVSLWSWGENIPIQLTSLADNKTKVQITSSPKTGIMFGGAFDMGKNRKNIESILTTTSRILSSKQSLPTTTETNQQSTLNQPNNFQTNLNSTNMEQENQTSNAWYEKTWVVVVLCIVFFPVGLYALWKNSSIGKGWKIGVTAIIALIIIANLVDKKSGDKTTSTSESSTTETATEKSEPKSKWSYSEDEDKMSGQKRYFGSCISTNEIEFEFPYNGGSSFTLTVRNMGHGNEVVLQVSKGQFMTSIGSSEALRAKFDDGQPMNFSYNSSSDGSMDVIFLNNAAKFISQLKQAKKLMVEVQFFSAGSKIIYFDVAGLNWGK